MKKNMSSSDLSRLRVISAATSTKITLSPSISSSSDDDTSRSLSGLLFSFSFYLRVERKVMFCQFLCNELTSNCFYLFYFNNNSFIYILYLGEQVILHVHRLVLQI